MPQTPVSSLPQVGIISNYINNIGAIANRYLPLAGKKVLCIGLSEAEITEHVGCHGPAAVTSLTLWPNHIDARTQKYELVIGDITKRTVFADDAFDAIITVSLLEHVAPLGDALREMRRITRRHGMIASIFGPVWSCAYGHHLYVIDEADPLLNFSKWQMPAYMHLLCSRADVADFYTSKGYSAPHVEKIVKTMFEWDGINRAMMSDYMSNFSDLFQIEYMETMYNTVDYSLQQRLRELYPDNRDFTTYGAKIVLRNAQK
jgi:SAM-dependent methyltransferase